MSDEPDFSKEASGPADPYNISQDLSYLASASASSTSGASVAGTTVQKNGALVGTEAKVDFEDGDITWTVTDDTANTRIKVTPAIGASKVTSAMVVDGTLVNGDISGSAGIALSKLANAYACRLTNSANVAVAQNTNTAISFDTEQFDVGGLHSGGAPTRLTIPATGVYQLGGLAEWATDGNGQRRLEIIVNGATILDRHLVQTPGGAYTVFTRVSTIHYLFSGDYIELFAFHDSGSLNTTNTILTNGHPYTPTFSAVYLGY